MRLDLRAIAIFIVLVVISLVDCMPANAAVDLSVNTPVNAPANAPVQSGKAYAVFVISYTATTAIGGVAGTAFFISGSRALTAYHVLQAISFRPQAGYTHSRVWLVHEGEPAIELHESNVVFDQTNDLTAITTAQSVNTEYVYKTDLVTQLGEVETEGFRASSVGPRLVRIGDAIEITDVPTLDRIRLQGSIVQRSRVDLQAIDVSLKETPCYQVSYEPIRGMSGGPLLSGGRVIGINSFADPRTKHQTWAVAFDPRRSALFVTQPGAEKPL